MTSLSAAKRCRLGDRPRPPGAAAVRRHDRLRERARRRAAGAGLRGQRAYDRCIDALELCDLVELANRRAESLGLLHRKRLELARALATDPVVLLLDEIGGGLTDAEALELVDDDQGAPRRGVAIVWIEHIVHVLVQVVERLVCMDAGRVIADGEPDAVMRDAAVIDAYLGSAAP